MVDYIKMTAQASELLNPQSQNKTPDINSPENANKNEATANTGKGTSGGKSGKGCLFKGCLVVVALHIAFLLVCIAIGVKDLGSKSAASAESDVNGNTSEAVAATAAGADEDEEEDEVDETEALAEEMGQILRSIVEANGYELSGAVDEWLEAYLYMKMPEFDESVSKARWMRVVFEKTIERHNARLAGIEDPTREQQTTITLKDVGIELKDPDASDED